MLPRSSNVPVAISYTKALLPSSFRAGRSAVRFLLRNLYGVARLLRRSVKPSARNGNAAGRFFKPRVGNRGRDTPGTCRRRRSADRKQNDAKTRGQQDGSSRKKLSDYGQIKKMNVKWYVDGRGVWQEDGRGKHLKVWDVS